MENGTSAGAACCVLCAATLGVGLGPAWAVNGDGAIGGSSSASMQIRVTMAERGALQGLADFAPVSAGSASDPLCLWLNTGTRNYSLSAHAEGSATPLFSWSTAGQSVMLDAEPSPTLKAAARPRCTADDASRLSATRISPDQGRHEVTILVRPE